MRFKKIISVVLSASLIMATPIIANAAGANGYKTDGAASLTVGNVYEGFARRWATPRDANLFVNSNGEYTRVEFVDNRVLIEEYDASYKRKSQKYITRELPIWGGAYMGSDANYLVFGQTNEMESDGVEVVKVVKYTKNWIRVQAASIYGINTRIPFDAGSLDMEELGGRLYIHSAHEMYKSPRDGLNHQATMNLVIDTDSMIFDDEASNYMVSNTGTGYVSHSFNQSMTVDGEYIYHIDHGDGYPRGIYLARFSAFEAYNYPGIYGNIYPIDGRVGENETNVEMGNIAVGYENALVGITSSKMTGNTVSPSTGVKNACLIVVPKNGGDENSIKTIWLSSITGNSSENYASAPYVCKINDNKFLIMWEEVINNTTTSRFVMVDNQGTKLTGIQKSTMEISEVEPVVNGEKVVWYSTGKLTPEKYGSYVYYKTDNTTPVFYEVDCSDENTFRISFLPDSEYKKEMGKIQAKKIIEKGYAARLFNTNTGDHIYTSDISEVNKLMDEGVYRHESTESPLNTFRFSTIKTDEFDTPVYRIYHKISKFHLYTHQYSEVEYNLNKPGSVWIADKGTNPVFYVSSNAPSGAKGTYRAFNPKNGKQHYCSKEEYDILIRVSGWKGNNDDNAYWYSY